MIQTGIFSLITGFPGVAALIGTRCYPVTLPENPTLPALRYQFAGGSSEPTFETSGMQKARIQFDAFAETADAAIALRDALIGTQGSPALNGYRGFLGDGTYLQEAQLVGPGTDYFETDPRQYRCMMEFYLEYTFHG